MGLTHAEDRTHSRTRSRATAARRRAHLHAAPSDLTVSSSSRSPSTSAPPAIPLPRRADVVRPYGERAATRRCGRTCTTPCVTCSTLSAPGSTASSACQTGDWSDGIASRRRTATRRRQGRERPRHPDGGRDPAARRRPRRARAPRSPPRSADGRGLRAAEQTTWTGSFFGRAYFGDGMLAYAERPEPRSAGRALIGDTFKPAGDATSSSTPSPRSSTNLHRQGRRWHPMARQVWPRSAVCSPGDMPARSGRARSTSSGEHADAHAEAFPRSGTASGAGPTASTAPRAIAPARVLVQPSHTDGRLPDHERTTRRGAACSQPSGWRASSHRPAGFASIRACPGRYWWTR